MSRTTKKSQLPTCYQRLLGVMQDIGFGTIEKLVIQGGIPVWDPLPCVIRTVKLGRGEGPRPEPERTDYQLKKEVVDCFDQLGRLRNAVVDIQVQHGLPQILYVREAA